MADCPPCKKGAPAWLLTFGDLMSLLLTFFILLISMSTTDIVKFKDMAGSLREAFGVQKIQQLISLPASEDFIATEYQHEIILVHLMQKLQVVLENSIDSGEAEVISQEEGFLIHLDFDLLLSPGSHKIRPEAKLMLSQIASLLKEQPNYIRIMGHTGSEKPSGNYDNNWEFSAFAAAAVVNFFATEGNIDPRKLQVRAMGQFAPKVSNASKEGRKENNRIEIMISREPYRSPSEPPEMHEKPKAGKGDIKPTSTIPSLLTNPKPIEPNLAR
ncbi:MAG: flagellar motor protein MotB [Magnetococcales bacterium]|nr:flagellar motor protein MotB [Magnetococcales bacterium]